MFRSVYLKLWYGLPLLILAAAPANGSSLRDTIQSLVPSIVIVGTHQATRRPPNQFLGTGFAVAQGNMIITNAHVLPKLLDSTRFEELAVFTGKADAVQRRKVLSVTESRQHDLALLVIDGDPLPVLRLGDSDRVFAGDDMAFTGFPIGSVLGMYPSTHRGIVSAVTPIIIPVTDTKVLDVKMIRNLRHPFDVFQLDAIAYPGNSGSPLYEPETGKVMGVLNMVYVKSNKEAVLKDPSGISYAIPAKYVQALIEKARHKSGKK